MQLYYDPLMCLDDHYNLHPLSQSEVILLSPNYLDMPQSLGGVVIGLHDLLGLAMSPDVTVIL